MSFPAILDVAIGLVVVFFLLASICSVLVEMISSWRRWRHNDLRATIKRLLGYDQAFERAFWTHPEMKPLQAPDTPSPGYLEGMRFATVVLDIATGRGAAGALPNTRNAFDRAIDTHAKGELQESLASLLRKIPSDAVDTRASFTSAIARWYDEAMARTSGIYKRRVQTWLFFGGLIVAGILNADTVRISYVLFRDPGLRSSMVDYARSVSKPEGETRSHLPANADVAGGQSDSPHAPSPTQSPAASPTASTAAATEAPVSIAELRSSLSKQIEELQVLESVGFPVGWMAPPPVNFLPLHTTKELPSWRWWCFLAIPTKGAGLLATALAVCLGAPFWFDILNKLVKLRSSGEKPLSQSGTQEGPSRAIAGGSSGQQSSMAVQSPVSSSRPFPSALEALREPGTQFCAAKASWLAEAALLAYAGPREVAAKIKNEWRFHSVTPFAHEKTETQGFIATGGGATIIAFRGTEPKVLKDWVTDARVKLVTKGQIPPQTHEGFSNALDSVFDQIDKTLSGLRGSGALLYITGHSLGGALATLCAARLAHSNTYSIQGLYTFGCPRVGNGDFAQTFRSLVGPVAYRLVNNEDLVTRVPPRTLGYSDVGEMVYIDDSGRLRHDIGFWYRFLNLVANAAEDFKKAAETTVRDHGMELYCGHLERAARSGDT